MIEIDPNDVNTYRNRGVAYILNGEYDKAIEDFSEAIDFDPKDAKAYGGRGEAYRKKGEFEKAAADEEKSKSLSQE